MLFGKTCVSKIMIEVKEPDGSPELEDAAMYILTTCHASPTQAKTVALSGDFPGEFIQRLSSNEAISLVLLHDQKRAEGYRQRLDVSICGKHKTDVLVTTADHWTRTRKLNSIYMTGVYRKNNASVIILNWSPNNKYGSCNETIEITKSLYSTCLYEKVLQNFACLTWGAETAEYALNLGNLHVSDNCATTDYTVNIVPWNWYQKDRCDKYLGLMEGASTLIPSPKALVEEKILHEKDSAEVLLEPEVMTLSDLGFAFAILGIGLACATITFIMEIIVHRYRRRTRTTRVIVLNRRG